MEVYEKRSFASVAIGLIFICMALSSLLMVRGLSDIPEYATFKLIKEDITVNIHELIYLLATPSLFVSSIWGEESMMMSMAFLFLGLGLSSIFRKKIAARIRSD